jgi:hypothetical protein
MASLAPLDLAAAGVTACGPAIFGHDPAINRLLTTLTSFACRPGANAKCCGVMLTTRSKQWADRVRLRVINCGRLSQLDGLQHEQRLYGLPPQGRFVATEALKY